MSFVIVVARYNENIDWLTSVIEKGNVILYNKGEKLGIPNEIMRPNVGRESETYLQYIIDNYPNFPDIIVFTQARISDHRKGISGLEYLFKLIYEAQQPRNLKSYPSVFHFNKKQYPREHCWDDDWNFENGKWYLEHNYKNNYPLLFKDWFQANIHPIYPNPISIYANGLFSIRKELILKHSLDYYKSLILEVNHHIDPTEGHFFERSWFYIFL